MVEVMFADREGDLWIGCRMHGIFCYDGSEWIRYGVQDGLADNRVLDIFQTEDGSIWASTPEGLSRFDGTTWLSQTLPLDVVPTGPQQIHLSKDGAIWFNYRDSDDAIPFNRRDSKYSTIRYQPDQMQPETNITLSVSEVSQPGNTTLAWAGSDPWRDTPNEELQYAWRMDREAWSPYSHEKSHIFELLPSGDHTLEVKTRDRDFNEDLTPASVTFTVVPPVWQQPWFIGMVIVLVGAIGLQTGRVIRRDRRLQDSNRKLEEANRAMSDANKELFAVNQALQRDRAVERIRGEVQAMEQASDFEGVLSLLSDDLRTVGLSFDTCGIDVLDETIDQPSMTYFENHGFRYTAYVIDPNGAVIRESYHILAPFPPVTRETIARFIVGEPWRGRSEQQAILEVPITGYGRVRLTTSDREDFSDSDIDALKDFASAIALGYARYLDIREIQEQTARKSAFLASMSHELRTPMNAIIGFTRMVLRRAGDALPERQKGNLEKVIEAGNRLLGLINDLLDLSKIEAGRMDVSVKRFDVKGLIGSCCAEVEPLVKEHVKLVCEVSDDLGEAETDGARVRHIVTNLLSNALKFTDAGEVKVHCKMKSANIKMQNANAGISGSGEMLEISVSDTGAGIPAESLETIFEEFQQVKGSDSEEKGTGLGLPICKGFAELLGGTIRVESEVGKGSTFTVRVPVVYRSED